MKATELKLGDWVYFDNPAREKKEAAKVVAILNDVQVNIVRLEDNAPLFVVISDILPIPLTKEMLEKNGWQWDEDDWVFYCEFSPHVYLAPSGKGFNVVDATGEQLGRINAAVHELQHLLWSLGIDDDLKI